MNILVTGSNGFVGKNLVENLKNIKDGKNRTTGLEVDEIYCFDVDTEKSLLDEFTQKADFVFNLAGVTLWLIYGIITVSVSTIICNVLSIISIFSSFKSFEHILS